MATDTVDMEALKKQYPKSLGWGLIPLRNVSGTATPAVTIAMAFGDPGYSIVGTGNIDKCEKLFRQQGASPVVSGISNKVRQRAACNGSSPSK